MTSDEILLDGQLDILVPNTRVAIEIVEKQIAEDFEVTLERFKTFYRSLRMAGTILAHFLYRLYLQYMETYQKTINDFAQMLYSEVGISPETTVKYLNVWRWIFENPKFTKEEKDKLIEQPIKKLILSYPALRDGDITPDDVVDAPTLYDLRQKIRSKVGERTSSVNVSYFTLSLRTGELVFHRGDQQTTVGILNVFDHTDPLREVGIERIIRCLGVLIQ